MCLVLAVHVRIKITARAPWASLAIRAGVILIDQRCCDSKCPRLRAKGTTAVVCLIRHRNIQRIMQDLKEIGLLGLVSVRIWVPANNTIEIRIGISWGTWSGMPDIPPVTGSLEIRVYYIGFSPK